MDNYYATVVAVEGGVPSEPVLSRTFSFNRVKTVDDMCKKPSSGSLTPPTPAETLRDLSFPSLHRFLGFPSGGRHPEGFHGFGQFCQSLPFLPGTEKGIKTQRSKIFLLHRFKFCK